MSSDAILNRYYNTANYYAQSSYLRFVFFPKVTSYQWEIMVEGFFYEMNLSPSRRDCDSRDWLISCMPNATTLEDMQRLWKEFVDMLLEKPHERDR